jgi:hypothetical protein
VKSARVCCLLYSFFAAVDYYFVIVDFAVVHCVERKLYHWVLHTPQEHRFVGVTTSTILIMLLCHMLAMHLQIQNRESRERERET